MYKCKHYIWFYKASSWLYLPFFKVNHLLSFRSSEKSVVELGRICQVFSSNLSGKNRNAIDSRRFLDNLLLSLDRLGLLLIQCSLFGDILLILRIFLRDCSEHGVPELLVHLLGLLN